VAVIMDGNGRWARDRGLPRTEGHRLGEERLAEIVRAAHQEGIEWLSAFGFSTENWQRPEHEVSYILSLHENIARRRDEMHRNNVRIRWIGRPEDEGSRIPSVIWAEMRKSTELTRDNTGLNFTMCFDYGGREELSAAARTITEQGVGAETITEATIASYLYEPTLPPVDLLIRTSGEHRLSNFLLWHVADAAFYITPMFWPDFTGDAFSAALRWWAGQRQR
jgi:undecaprenyl diphosphate synthase